MDSDGVDGVKQNSDKQEDDKINKHFIVETLKFSVINKVLA